MNNFSHLFDYLAVFQLMAALNLAHIWQGFRCGFYSLIQNWDKGIRSLEEIHSLLVAIKEDSKSLSHKVKEELEKSKENDNLVKKIGLIPQLCDDQEEDIRNIQQYIISYQKLNENDGSDILSRPPFLVSGVLTILTMLFITIANKYTVFIPSVYFFILFSLILTFLTTYNCCNLHKNIRRLIYVIAIFSISFVLLHFLLFIPIMKELYCGIAIQDIYLYISLSMMILMCSITYFKNIHDIFEEYRGREKIIESKINKLSSAEQKIKQNYDKLNQLVKDKLSIYSISAPE